MSKLKKLASALLALVMAFGLTCTAFAASGTLTLTITNSVSDYEYTAYQVFAGDLSTDKKTLSNVVWGDAIAAEKQADALAAVKAITIGEGTSATKPFANCSSAADIAEVLSGESNDSAIAKAFAEAISSYVSVASGTSTRTSDNTGYTISNLAVGYYFVKTTKVPENGTHTEYILALVGDATVETKSETVTIDKTVGNEASTNDPTTNDDSTEDYDVGDDVPFTLTATLPSNYAEYTTYKLTFHDTLSSGLSFNGDVVVKVGDTVVDDSCYTVTTPAAGDAALTDGCSFEVLITNTNALKDKSGNDITVTAASVITVSYTAELLSAAQSVESNAVKLEYSNNPNDDGSGTGTSTEDKTYVVTFTLTVDKTDGTNALAGAGFTLYKKADVDSTTFTSTGYYTVVDGVMTAVDTTATYDSSETYYVAVKTISAGTTTTFTFSGLATGDYVLVESTTPDGYNTADDIHFTIDAETVESSTGVSVTTLQVKDASNTVISSTSADDKKTFTVNLGAQSLTTEVINNRGNTLPSTGGIGTTIFYVVGGVLVVGAVVLLITKKRMSE